MSRGPLRRTHQRGATLIEGLIAIAVFSIGIAAILGVVAKMVVGSTDAQYRAQASQLAESIVADIRGADPATMVTNYSSGGTNFIAWNSRVTNQLPLVGTATTTLPLLININATTGVVTVTIHWRSPQDKTVDPLTSTGTPHSYATTTYLD